MKKNSSCRQSPKRGRKAGASTVTVGMDLGDKTSRYCMLDEDGEVVREASVGTTKKAMTQVIRDHELDVGWQLKWGPILRG